MWLSNIDTENNAQKILTEKDIISKGKKGIYAGCVCYLCGWWGRGEKEDWPSHQPQKQRVSCSPLDYIAGPGTSIWLGLEFGIESGCDAPEKNGLEQGSKRDNIFLSQQSHHGLWIWIDPQLRLQSQLHKSSPSGGGQGTGGRLRRVFDRWDTENCQHWISVEL